MLKINLYLHIILLLNGFAVICENEKLSTVLHTNPDTLAVKNSLRHPIQEIIFENFKRKKRVSHHGINHHHYQQVPIKLSNGKSTNKQVVIHTSDRKAHKSQRIDCNKRHIAFEVYAKRINQTVNSTEKEKQQKSTHKSTTSALNNLQVDLLKRNDNTSISSSNSPSLTSTVTPSTPITTKLIIPYTTHTFNNVTSLTTLAKTQDLSSNLTKSSAVTPSSISTQSSLTFAENATTVKSLEIDLESASRGILTRVFIIPIQESSNIKFKTGRSEKTSKRSDSKSEKLENRKKTLKLSKAIPRNLAVKNKNKKRKKGIKKKESTNKYKKRTKHSKNLHANVNNMRKEHKNSLKTKIKNIHEKKNQKKTALHAKIHSNKVKANLKRCRKASTEDKKKLEFKQEIDRDIFHSSSNKIKASITNIIKKLKKSKERINKTKNARY